MPTPQRQRAADTLIRNALRNRVQEECRAEGPYGGTIAHGALTLSLCTSFLTEIVQVRGVSHVVNAGFDRVRFRSPVPVGSRLRGAAVLLGSRRMGAGARVGVRVTAELEGESRPACVADQILVFQPPAP